MSFIQAGHQYKCVVSSIEQPNAEFWPVSVNGRRIRVPLGEQTVLPGTHINALNDAAYEKPVMDIDPETGQRKIVGSKWAPRFSVQVIADLTANLSLEVPALGEGYVINKTEVSSKGAVTFGDEPKDYDNMGFQELRREAFAKGVKNVNNLKKQDLINELKGPAEPETEA